MTASNRLFINLASNVLNFGLSVLVGIWLTPYLIRHLGVGAYGLIPLAITMSSYLSLFTVALNSTTGRFMTIALERNDHDEANRIFNTSLWSCIVVAVLLLGPCLWISFHAGRLLEVPQGSDVDAIRLLASMLGVFLMTTILSTFTTSSFCRNRFDLANAVNIVTTLSRLALIVLFFSIWQPQAWHVGLATLLAAALSMAGAVLIWKHLTPMLRIRPSQFSLASLRSMTDMGGWILVNHMGSILFLSIDLLVINRLLGPECTGRYGAVMTWATLLRSLAGVIAGVFTPTIIMLHSRNDTPGLIRYSRQAVKLLGLAISIPIGLICGLSTPLLRLWLGDEYVPLAPLMSMMTFHLCINLAVMPLFGIQVATQRVRIPGIVTAAMGVANLILAITLTEYFGWGMYGVAAAGAIALTAKNLIFTPWYGARITGAHWAAFYREMMPIAAMTCALIVASWLVATTLWLNSWQALMGAGALLALGAGALSFFYVLTQSERSQVVTRLAVVLPRAAP